MSFVQRLIDATFTLGTGSFGSGGSNTVKLSGVRASAKVIKAGGRSMGTLDMSVYGMTPSDMNQLSTLGMIATTLRRNGVLVEAGDAVSGMGTVFVGTITNAYPDFQGAPDVAFRVEAHTGAIDALIPQPPTSVKGSADVATLLAGLAAQMGVSFENNGVTTQLSNPYFAGPARVQARAIVEAAGCEWNAVDNGILAIWNPGESRGGEVPLISPDTGLVGYPSYASNGIQFVTLFNPSIGFGQKVQVKSSLEQACGTWTVYGLDHDLETMTPNGQWFSTVQAAQVGLGPFVPS